MTTSKAAPDTLAFVMGDEVYHKTEPSKMGIVIGIIMRPGTYVIEVQWTATTSSNCYPFELTKEKSFDP